MNKQIEALAEAEKQEWQSLSDDEMMKTIESWENKLGRHLGLRIARAIEQTLKDKNKF